MNDRVNCNWAHSGITRSFWVRLVKVLNWTRTFYIPNQANIFYHLSAFVAPSVQRRKSIVRCLHICYVTARFAESWLLSKAQVIPSITLRVHDLIWFYPELNSSSDKYEAWGRFVDCAVGMHSCSLSDQNHADKQECWHNFSNTFNGVYRGKSSSLLLLKALQGSIR